MNNEKALNWLYNNHPDFTWDMVDFALPAQRGVYCIYDKRSNMAYIGSASNVRYRVCSHKMDLKKNVHHNPFLKNAYEQGELIFFCVRLAEYRDSTLLLEAHWANVFGENRVFNIASVSAIISSCAYCNSSTESISLAEGLGYPFIFDSCFNAESVRVAFSRFTPERQKENSSAIESARKLII